MEPDTEARTTIPDGYSQSAVMAGPPLLELQGVSKAFGSVAALIGVDLTIRRGEVLGLLGDNGAGKSTLIKVLAGVHKIDSGTFLWEGTPVVLRSPQDAIAMGISTAFQDLAIVNQMSIWRNLYLGHESLISRPIGPFRGPFRLLRDAKAKSLCRNALADLGIHIANVDSEVGQLSGGERQSIAIARAVYFESKLLILDEPTSALSVAETEKVLGYVRRAREHGLGVVIITHNVHHAMAVSDRFVVLHHGKVAWRCDRSNGTLDNLNLAITTGSGPTNRKATRREAGLRPYD